MPPRKLRNKGSFLEIPEGFEPMNPDAYMKKFGHRLAREQLKQRSVEAILQEEPKTQ